MDIAAEKPEKLSRVIVSSFDEGENIPANSVKVEEIYYTSVFQKPAAGIRQAPAKGDSKGQGKGRGQKKDGPKSSPWGISPEETAAKKAAAKKAQQNK